MKPFIFKDTPWVSSCRLRIWLRMPKHTINIICMYYILAAQSHCSQRCSYIVSRSDVIPVLSTMTSYSWYKIMFARASDFTQIIRIAKITIKERGVNALLKNNEQNTNNKILTTKIVTTNSECNKLSYWLTNFVSYLPCLTLITSVSWSLPILSVAHFAENVQSTLYFAVAQLYSLPCSIFCLQKKCYESSCYEDS